MMFYVYAGLSLVSMAVMVLFTRVLYPAEDPCPDWVVFAVPALWGLGAAFFVAMLFSITSK